MLLAEEVDEVDALDYAWELRTALAEYLDAMEGAYRDRARERPEQFPQIWFNSSLQLPDRDGFLVEYPGVVHYHHGGEPDRVDILYGGEGYDPPLATWQDSWHGHVVALRNDQIPEGADRWRVVIWLAPGVRGNRKLLLQDD